MPACAERGANSSRKMGVALFEKLRENWMRPALFFGNNPLSLLGGAITTASGVTMIGYWLFELIGRHNNNPYLGIIFFLILPALFILGLALIPVGIYRAPPLAAKGRRHSRRVSPDRPERPHLPPRHRHRAGGHHRQSAGGLGGQLPRRRLYGFAAVLRAVLPCDAPGIRRVQGLRTLPCGLRGLPHRHRRQLLLRGQGQRHQAAH